MKKTFLFLLGIVLMATSCLDLADVYGRLDQLEKKVADLEGLNNTVSGLSTTIKNLEGNVYVKEVVETADGYVIKFTNGTQATIKDGEDGEDGTTPTIGVKDVDGTLCWTVNNEVVKDETGAPVPATVKVPEFKFENNKWWYRFGATDTWKDCGEKTGPEPSITETEEFVIITIGDKSVQIPKEVISPAIEAINPVITLKNANGDWSCNRLFVPVGKSVDLKDFFEVEPEGALKSMVEYTPADGAAFTVTEKGILTPTDAGSKNVVLTAKNDPNIQLTFTIRSGDDAADAETTVDPEQKIKIYKGSLEEFNQMVDFGGTTAFNPFNGAIAGVFNGNLNFRIGMPVTPNDNITMDNGRLHFMFYVSDASAFDPTAPDNPTNPNFLEHTSSGSYDAYEVDYDMRTLIPTLKNGWNEIDLPLKDFTAPGGDGKYDPTKASFIRFLCNANTGGAWLTYQMKDLFVYAEEAPAQITIDGDMSDWAKVKGAKSDNSSEANDVLKVASDENNIYFYSRRNSVRLGDIWGANGYWYYCFDLDNDPSTGVTLWDNGPYEMLLVIYPYGGTADAPEFKIAKAGAAAPNTCTVDHAVIKGVKGDDFVETEISIPRADLLPIPSDTPVKVTSWGNKSGGPKLTVSKKL